MSTIERTSKLATTVDTLTDAFAFVMAHVDDVGSAPSVHITPRWWDDSNPWADNNPRYRFEVCVSGMVEDGAL